MPSGGTAFGLVAACDIRGCDLMGGLYRLRAVRRCRLLRDPIRISFAHQVDDPAKERANGGSLRLG